jgi:hypothetical protein
MLSRPTGVTAPEQHANVLLLPWPLRVRARDFRRAPYELPQMDATEFGFFTFEPAEALDLELVESVLQAALDEAGTVDIVILPECAITPADVAPLEALFGEYGVWTWYAGVREPCTPSHLGGNWVHIGVRQEMVWRHATQHKHHRWCLDGRQLGQYHLGGALSPTMRWWEAVSLPQRSLHVIDQGAVTLVVLLCEDLARLEPVADLVRSIGPSCVVTLLLDGPQLSSRWTARYASVLADDPGSAVVTLTSHGMVRRCRPPGCDPSRVVAMWKDATGGLTEITLEDGADAVLISTSVTVGGSYTADGRPPSPTTSIALAAAQSLYAREASAEEAHPRQAHRPPADGARPLPDLDEAEVSKATSWVEAFAEAAVADPGSVRVVLDDATALGWREPLRLPHPTRLFDTAIDALRRELPACPTLDDLLAAAHRLHCSEDPASAVTGLLLEIALEQRLAMEVGAGRLPQGALAALSAIRHS